MLEEYLTRDKLVKIMLDKDNMIKTEIVPTDEDYYIKCPTERKFDDCFKKFGMGQKRYQGGAYFVVKYYLQ